jgi:diadenosine tetraphosphate (Ap4A) HIT family hydrolase
LTTPDCPFCLRLRTNDESAASEVVWRFPRSVALLGPWQYYHGYCVLVAGRHAEELTDLPADERRAYFDEMCLLAQAIQACCRPHKLNYELLGNRVRHLHWHLFPRYLDDPDRLRAVWPSIERAERDPEWRRRLETGRAERGRTAADLRETLERLGAPRA